MEGYFNMIQDYFTVAEIADTLGVDEDMVRDLLADKGEWQTNDVNRLLNMLHNRLCLRQLND